MMGGDRWPGGFDRRMWLVRLLMENGSEAGRR